MATIMYDGEQIAGGGVSIVHMTEQQYLQNKTALDASDLLIEITDKDYPVEAGNIGFTPPTGMTATNVQDGIEEVRLIKVVGAVRTITLNTKQTTWYGFLDPNGLTTWSGYDLSKIVSFNCVIDQFGTDGLAIPMGTWIETNGYPSVGFVNRSEVQTQTLKYHIVAYFRP